MGKSKEKEEKDPFASFAIIKGEFVPPEEDDSLQDDEIETGDKTVIPEVITNLDPTQEKAKLEAGTKIIEENIKKAEALKKSKEKELIPENEEEDDETKISPIKSLVDDWYNKGILDFNSEDPDFTDSEDTIDKLVEKTRDNRVNKWAESLPQEFNDFLDYVQGGGKPKDFLNIYYGNYSWEGFNLETIEAQRLAVKESLILGGESPEDAEDVVKMFEHNSILDAKAKTALSKLQKNEAFEKENLLKKQKDFVEKQEKARKEQFESFKKDLFSKEDLMGFKLTPKLKDQLWDFMTIIDKKTGKTGYQVATETNKDSSLLFALQAMKGFNIGSLEKQVQTKVSNNIGQILKNYSTDSKSKISKGVTPPNIDTNPFDLFKTQKA